LSERTPEELDAVIESLQEKDISDDVWTFKAEVFEMMRNLGFYPEDAEGPDHEDELRTIMVRLVEEH